MIIKEPEFIEVDSIKQLPPAPDGYRWIDFLGGEKTLQCCLVPQGFSRNQFVKQFGYMLDEAIQPIYDYKGINVAQDYSFAIPGFYIVAYDQQIRALDHMDDNFAFRTANIIKYVRMGMRNAIGIKQINLYHDERATDANSVHYGLMPKYGFAQGDESLYHFDLPEYLKQFNFKDTRSEIIQCNRKMKEFIQLVGLKAKDDAIIDMNI